MSTEITLATETVFPATAFNRQIGLPLPATLAGRRTAAWQVATLLQMSALHIPWLHHDKKQIDLECHV